MASSSFARRLVAPRELVKADGESVLTTPFNQSLLCDFTLLLRKQTETPASMAV